MARDADGRVVFVRGALPGETVAVEIVESKRDFARADVAEVLAASSHRVVPPCPHRIEGCGGCDWQHLHPVAQLGAKAAIVTDALRRTARLEAPDVRVGGAVPTVGYRTTVRVVGTPDGRAGFRHERSHDTVAAAGCLVAHPRLVEVIDVIRVSPGLEVVLRCSTSSDQTTAVWDHRQGGVDGLPPNVGVGADAAVHQVVSGVDLRVSAMSFFQSGPGAAELLVDAVRRAAPELDRAARVADLYAGVGLFAATVVPRTAAVTLVESSPPAVADARINVPWARVVRAEVGRWKTPTADAFDVVVADPPRSGLGAQGARAVVAAGAEVVVLVSCDPAAAARDVQLLQRAGYRHEVTEVLDVFPHTHHVETVTRFTRTDRNPSP